MIDDRNFWRRMYRIFGKAWKMARKWLRNASIAIGSMVRVAWYRGNAARFSLLCYFENTYLI